MSGIVLFTVVLIVLECASCACPNRWRANQASCYLFFHEAYTFFGAKVACDVVGAYLVEIDTPAENDFIVSLAKELNVPNLWIGMEDLLVEGEYEWTSTHTRPAYYNWIAGDPNNWNSMEDCVGLEVKSGGWYDIDCEQKYPYICEAPVLSAGVIG